MFSRDVQQNKSGTFYVGEDVWLAFVPFFDAFQISQTQLIDMPSNLQRAKSVVQCTNLAPQSSDGAPTRRAATRKKKKESCRSLLSPLEKQTIATQLYCSAFGARIRKTCDESPTSKLGFFFFGKHGAAHHDRSMSAQNSYEYCDCFHF